MGFKKLRLPSIGIRVWLLLLVLTTLLPFLAFSAYSIYRLGQDQAEIQELELMHHAQAAALSVAKRLEVSQNILGLLASSEEAQRPNLPALHALAKRLTQLTPGNISISLIDANLNMVFITSEPYGAPGFKIHYPEEARAVFQNQKSSASPPIYSPIWKQWVVAVTVPVVRNGVTEYVLRMVVPIDEFRQILKDLNLPQAWNASLFHHSGQIIARTSDHDEFVGQPAVHLMVKLLLDRREGAFEHRNLRGEMVRGFLVQVQGWDWMLGVAAPSQKLSDAVFDALIHVVLVGLFFTLLALALSFSLARYLAQQVKNNSQLPSLGSDDAPQKPPKRSIIKELLNLSDQADQNLRREQRTTLALQNVKAMHQQVTQALHEARHDPLTHLPNRSLFMELVHQLQASVAPTDQCMAFLFIDLDGFKGVNDQYGHEKGDEILRNTADVLRAVTRDSDVSGRLGGDEFVMCISETRELIISSAQQVATRVIEKVETLAPNLGCSIGISVWSARCPNLSCAMRKADAAMYQAKHSGKNQFVMAHDSEDVVSKLNQKTENPLVCSSSCQ